MTEECPIELKRFTQYLLAAQQIQAMHPSEHPRVIGAVRELYLHANEMLADRSEMRIALADSEIVFENAPIATNTDLMGGLAALFRRQGVGKLIMRDGVRRWEINAFVGALNATQKELSAAGGMKPLLAGQGIEHVVAGPLRLGKQKEPGPTRREALPQAWQVYSKGLRTVRRVRRDLVSGEGARAVAASASLATEMVEAVRDQPDVFLLLHSLQRHDEYSFTHSLNVAMLSLTIARKMGINGAALVQMAMAALLHDIGKELVPDEVLNKPGKLTEEKWEVMQRHSADGTKLLLRSPSASDLSVVVAYEHQLAYEHDSPDHGQWELHFVSDVVCIADVYDALRSNRPYRAAVPADRAMKIMQEEASKKFDSALFRGFRRMVGHYPPGTCVRLASGHLAVADRVNPDDPTRPHILVVRDPDGHDVEPPRSIDLASQTSSSIESVIDGAQVHLDPLDYL